MHKGTLLCVLALVFAARAVTYRRVADIPSSAIVTTNQWTRFDAVTLNFNLPRPQLAVLHYNAGCNLDEKETHMVTRLVVDGEVLPGSATVNGIMLWHTNTVSVPVDLGTGNHVVELWYRTPSVGITCPLNDWGGVVLTAALV
eukprot:m51a1_g1096 hypothetical protein (143) ;mRNA; f:78911-79339